MARVGRYSITLRLRGRELPTSMPVRNGSESSRMPVSGVVCWEKQLLAQRSGRLASFADCTGKHGRTRYRALLQCGRQTISDDLLANAKLTPAAKPLTIFRAELTGCDEAGWEELFNGYTALKAITFSSSIEILLRLAEQLTTWKWCSVSERILSEASGPYPGYPDRRTPMASPIPWWITRCWSRPFPLLGRAGQTAARPRRRRLTALSPATRRPSHEKLYLLSGPAGSRVVTGSRQSQPRRL